MILFCGIIKVQIFVQSNQLAFEIDRNLIWVNSVPSVAKEGTNDIIMGYWDFE